MLAVDGVDIVRFLTTIGLADRDDLRAAVSDIAAAHQVRLARKPLAQQLHAELGQALKASTSLTSPRRLVHTQARNHTAMWASSRVGNPGRSC